MARHPSLDGFFLIVDYTEERDGKISYRGHGIGFPPKAAIVGHLEGTT